MVGNTREKILEVSKIEFLDKGFDGASLREIAKKAGITTGAIYGYFDSKDEIFSNLVKDVAEEFLNLQQNSHLKYTNVQAGGQLQNMQRTNYLEDIIVLIDYIYEHFDVFKLLICYSDKTSYESYFSQLVSRHIGSAEKMVEKMGFGKDVRSVDSEFVEIITNSYLSDIFEIVKRDMPRKKAIDYVIRISSYYGAGWLSISKTGSSRG